MILSGQQGKNITLFDYICYAHIIHCVNDLVLIKILYKIEFNYSI